jgi:hypothetical protein
VFRGSEPSRLLRASSSATSAGDCESILFLLVLCGQAGCAGRASWLCRAGRLAVPGGRAGLGRAGWPALGDRADAGGGVPASS